MENTFRYKQIYLHLDGYKKIADNIFSIDAIIHNSGISHYGLFVDTDPEILEENDNDSCDFTPY